MESNVTEKVVELFVQIGMFSFFVTPVTFLISVIGISKSYHRSLVIAVAVFSVVPWIIYGLLLLLFELGFGPPPVPENAPFGVAIGHAFAVMGFIWPFMLGMATASLLAVSCFVVLLIKYYREKSLQ